MSFMEFKKFIIKKLDRHEEHYKSLTDIMKELQPLAFLISASLILAAFLKDKPVNQGYALFASVLFFLAYIGLAFYNITKYKWFFYWGLSLILLSIYFLYNSFGDVISIILEGSKENNFLLVILLVVTSMVIIFNKYFLDNTNNKNLFYKILSFSFWVESVLIIIFLLASIYLNIYIFTLGLFLAWALLMINLMLTFLSQMRNK